VKNRNNEVYLIGGWDGRSQYLDVYLYKAEKNELSLLDVSEGGPSPRAGHSVVGIGDTMLLFGGACCEGGPYTFYNDLYLLDLPTLTWKEIEIKGDKPAPRAQHTALCMGHYLLIIGGYNGDSLLSDIWLLDLKNTTSSQWQQLKLSKSSPSKSPSPETGLQKSNFRVIPATHTSHLIAWDSARNVGHIFVAGLANSDSYLVSISPEKGTMEWQALPTKFAFPRGHTTIGLDISREKNQAGKFKGEKIILMFGGRAGNNDSQLVSFQLNFDLQ